MEYLFDRIAAFISLLFFYPFSITLYSYELQPEIQPRATMSFASIFFFFFLYFESLCSLLSRGFSPQDSPIPRWIVNASVQYDAS